MFLGFFSHLVQISWFSTVRLFYLMPGHSHDMVDRECFGPLGTHHRFRVSFWTIPDFREIFIAKAFRRRQKKPEYLEPAVWDWKSWISPHLLPISAHSFQRAFLIKKEDGGSVMYYKGSVLSSDWRGDSGSQNQCISF